MSRRPVYISPLCTGTHASHRCPGLAQEANERRGELHCACPCHDTQRNAAGGNTPQAKAAAAIRIVEALEAEWARLMLEREQALTWRLACMLEGMVAQRKAADGVS